MSEIARLRAKAAELKHGIMKLEMVAAVHIDDICKLLNRHVVDSVSEIDIEQAASTMVRLKDDITQIRRLQAKLQDIEQEIA